MGHPRALLVAACLAATLLACAHGASATERDSQGLELSRNRKLIGLATQSRDLLQYQRAGYTQPYYQQGGYNQPYYQQGAYNQPYSQQGGYNQPYYQQAGTAARYPSTTSRYRATPSGYSSAYRPSAYGGTSPQGRNPVGYGPTMMGRLFERVTGVPAAARPPLGDRLGNLMNGVGSVVRTVGDVFNIISKFKD